MSTYKDESGAMLVKPFHRVRGLTDRLFTNLMPGNLSEPTHVRNVSS